jgi:hypothetical protein
MSSVEGQHIASESDERTVNNAMRHQYRVLSEEEKRGMVNIKDIGAALINAINLHVPVGREGSLAKTRVEEAVMWAVKGLTS